MDCPNDIPAACFFLFECSNGHQTLRVLTLTLCVGTQFQKFIHLTCNNVLPLAPKKLLALKKQWYYRPRLKEIYKPRSMICSTLIPYAKSLCNASLDISSHFHPICAHSSSSPYRRTYFRISESEMIPLRRFSSSITTSRWTLDFRIVSKIESSLSSSLHV